MIYVLAAYAFIFLLNPLLAKRHLKLYYIITVLILTALAYFVVPSASMDLYRYTQIMTYIRQMGYDWGLNQYGSDNPLMFLFLYGVSLLNNDKLLPAIAVLVVYSFSLALLYKAIKRYDADYSCANIAFIFLMFNLNYCYVIDVVRIYIAYAILAFFLYMDLVEKKHRLLCMAVYIMLCYFHYAILVFLLIRIAFFVTSRFKGVLSVAAIFVVSVVLALCYNFSEYFSGLNNLLGIASDKISGYSEYDTFGIWQFLVSLARMGTFLVISIVVAVIYYEVEKRLSPFNDFGEERAALKANQFSVMCMYINFTNVMFITNYQYVLRTPYLIQMMISAPVVYALTYLKRTRSRYNDAFRFFILFESIAHMIYLIAYVYGNLEFTLAV